MQRLSSLIRQFHEGPDEVRNELRPAVLLWREAPARSTQELLWQTVPRFEANWL